MVRIAKDAGLLFAVDERVFTSWCDVVRECDLEIVRMNFREFGQEHDVNYDNKQIIGGLNVWLKICRKGVSAHATCVNKLDKHMFLVTSLIADTSANDEDVRGLLDIIDQAFVARGCKLIARKQ